MSILQREHNNKEVALTISTETYIRVVALVISTIFLLAILHKIAPALVLIFSALFLSIALNAPVEYIAKRLPGKENGSRAIATSMSFLIVVIILALFFTIVVPPLVHQSQSFIHTVPNLINEYQNQNSPLSSFVNKYHLQSQYSHFTQQLSSYLNNAGGAAFSTLQSIGTSIFTVLTVIVLTFMMLVEGPRWVGITYRLIPRKKRKVVSRIAEDMYEVIKGFVNGQVMLAAIASVLISPALFILHISFPVALILVIFICGLIPMVGHTIGAIIITLVALFNSTSSAAIILAYYLLYQQFENYIIQPKIQANTTKMSPLLVFASIIVGVSFGGLLGGLLAIPIAACLRILAIEYIKMNDLLEVEPKT